MSGAVVQSTQLSWKPGVSSAAAPSQNNTTGNVMCVVVQCNPSNTPTVSDTYGNTYTLIEAAGLYANGLKMFSAPINTGGSNNVVTATGGTFNGIWAAELSGVTNTGVTVAGQPQNGPTTAPDAITTTAITLPGTPAFVVALSYNATGINSGNTDPGPAAGTGFTGITGLWTVNSGSGQALATAEYAEVTTGTTKAATFTTTKGSDLFVTLGAAFQESSSGVVLTAGELADTLSLNSVVMTANFGSATLLAAPLAYVYDMATSTSDEQLDAGSVAYTFSLTDATLAASITGPTGLTRLFTGHITQPITTTDTGGQ